MSDGSCEKSALHQRMSRLQKSKREGMHLNPHSLLLRESGKARLNRHTMKKLSYLRRECLAGPSGPGDRCTGPRALGSIPVGRLP